jgi:death-on-curing protein
MGGSEEAVVQHVRSEHARWLREIGEEDPYAGRTTVGIKDVLRAHFMLAEYFAREGEGLGGIGPKNLNLLHSALYRQVAEFKGKPKWSDRIDVCASLMYGLIQNHPFHDANKRTAFLTALLHLQKIGRTPTVDGQEFEDFTVAIADHNLEKHPYYDRTSGAKEDRDVATISKFLRRNSREIDLRHSRITYKRLKAILAPHGLTLAHPQHNRIDLMRIKDGAGMDLDSPKRLARIGFHSWTIQVSPKDINIVRSAAHMELTDGYDSQSFFHGVETPLQLIQKYRDPLERLAFR